MVKIHLLPVVQVGEQRDAAHDRHDHKGYLDKRIVAEQHGHLVKRALPGILHILRGIIQIIRFLLQRPLHRHQHGQQQGQEKAHAGKDERPQAAAHAVPSKPFRREAF